MGDVFVRGEREQPSVTQHRHTDARTDAHAGGLAARRIIKHILSDPEPRGKSVCGTS